MIDARGYVFDTCGKLFDVHAAIGRHRAAAGPDADRFSEIWRSKQLEYTWTLTLAGCYIFQRNRRSRRDADNITIPTRRGGRGGVRSEGQSPCSEIPNRAFTPYRLALSLPCNLTILAHSL
jgi:hypothetical protein